MAKGLLVSFAGAPMMISSLFPDNGLASLAGTLLAQGHEVKVLDFNTTAMVDRLVRPDLTAALSSLLPSLTSAPEPDVLRSLLEIEASLEESLTQVTQELAQELASEVEVQGSHFVGFKLWSGDGFRASVQMANHLRRLYPSLKIYGGGPAVLYSEHALYSLTDAFDALVDGEGEIAILGLAAHAEGQGDLALVPNLILKDGANIRRTKRVLVADMNTLARPAYGQEVYPSLAGDQKIKIFVLDESRGCPMSCSFCVHPQASGHNWRMKAGERVAEEIQALGDLHGSSCFRLGGSNIPLRFLEELMASLPRQGRPIWFTGFCHPTCLPENRLEALAEAGCRSLFIGVESFHPPDQALLGKRINAQKVFSWVRACKSSGIVPGISLIVPAPGQTQEGLAVNRQAILDLCADTRAQVLITFPGLVPRSQWWERRQEHGFRLLVDEGEYKRLFVTYRIRHIIPPSYWQPLPYTLDGRSFAEITRISTLFQSDLASQGVVLNGPDEFVMAADLLGEPLSSFRRRHRDVFFTHDAFAIGTLARELNGRLGAL